MAHEASDREDLLREATALVRRAELTLQGSAESIVAGFRREGSFSLFFGADPVYQFNAQYELRRAYLAGKLYKAERGTLVALTRQRLEDQVVLLRHKLSLTETYQFLAGMTDRLTQLRDALRARTFTLVGQVPPDANVVGLILNWLESLRGPIKIADHPRV